MIIEFGLDGQNLCDPTAVFSKPFTWLLIHVLCFVSFARCCIWKLLITLQACSDFLCHYFFFPSQMKMFCLHYSQSSDLSPSLQSRSTENFGQSRPWNYFHGKKYERKKNKFSFTHQEHRLMPLCSLPYIIQLSGHYGQTKRMGEILLHLLLD